MQVYREMYALWVTRDNVLQSSATTDTQQHTYRRALWVDRIVGPASQMQGRFGGPPRRCGSPAYPTGHAGPRGEIEGTGMC